MSIQDAYENPQENQKDKSATSSFSVAKRFLPLVIIFGFLGLGYSFGLHEYLSLDTINENKAAIEAYVSENLFLSMAGFLIVYIVAVALSFPGASFLTIAGGAIFGWFIGGTLTLFGATIGASIIFLVAKTSLGDFLAERAGPRMSKLRDGFQKDAFNYLLTLRLAPVVPFWITNLAPALFGMDLFRYALATFIGIVPGTYAYAFIGNQLGAAVGDDITKKITLGLAALAVASVIPLIVKRLRAKKDV